MKWEISVEKCKGADTKSIPERSIYLSMAVPGRLSRDSGDINKVCIEVFIVSTENESIDHCQTY